MDVISYGEDRRTADVAARNMKQAGYDPLLPERLVIGKSPAGDGWADPVTGTVFVSEEKETLLQHEFIHVDQYTRILENETDHRALQALENQAFDQASDHLKPEYMSLTGLGEYPWIGNIEAYLNAVSDPSYLRDLGEEQDKLESESLTSSERSRRFQDTVEHENSWRGPETWRRAPGHIQPLVDLYIEYLETDVPLNRMEAEPLAWETFRLLKPTADEPMHREINRVLRQKEQAYGEERYDPGQVRQNAQELIYDWHGGIQTLEDLGGALEGSLERYG